ncbi:MAG: hypothetical protein V2J20_04775 [Wenzhouxiangella sp.]|jgi:hypothetical protein|nr:hypothetical protein [Wenzhouxiangella sp.]
MEEIMSDNKGAQEISQAIQESISANIDFLSRIGDRPDVQADQRVQTAAWNAIGDVAKEGLKVWQEYIKLADSKEKTKQVFMQSQTALEKIDADLRKAEISHEKFNERTVDIRRMIDATLDRIQPLSELMGLMLQKGDLLTEDVALFDRAMSVNKQIIELMTSLHRFMEKR